MRFRGVRREFSDRCSEVRISRWGLTIRKLAGSEEDRVELGWGGYVPRAPATTLRSKADGTVTIRQTFEAHGLFRQYLEGEDGATIEPEELRRRIYRSAVSRNPEVQNLTSGEIQRRSDGAWSYEFSYDSSEYLSEFGDLRVLELGSLAPLEFLPATHDADEVVFMPLRATLRDVSELEHDGWGLVAAIDDRKTENAAVTRRSSTPVRHRRRFP